MREVPRHRRGRQDRPRRGGAPCSLAGCAVRAAVRPGREGCRRRRARTPVAVDLATGAGSGGGARRRAARPTTSRPTCTPTRSGSRARVAEAATAAGRPAPRVPLRAAPRRRAGCRTTCARPRPRGRAARRPSASGSRCCAPRPTTRTSSAQAPAAGMLRVPYSLDAPFTNVDLDDVAEVAARRARCGAHAGATLDLAGPGGAHDPADGRGRPRSPWAAPVSDTRISLEDVAVAGPGAALADQARDDLAAMFTRVRRGRPGRATRRCCPAACSDWAVRRPG